MSQQQYYQPPFQQPPRPKRWFEQTPVIITLGVALTIILGVIYVAIGRSTTGPSSSATSGSTTHVVRYEADGGGARGARSASITLQTSDGGTSQQSGVALPLTTKAGTTGLEYSGFERGDFVYLSVQNGDAAGSVTCRIVVDGNVISENTSDGGYTIATCSSRVP